MKGSSGWTRMAHAPPRPLGVATVPDTTVRPPHPDVRRAVNYRVDGPSLLGLPGER